MGQDWGTCLRSEEGFVRAWSGPFRSGLELTDHMDGQNINKNDFGRVAIPLHFSFQKVIISANFGPKSKTKSRIHKNRVGAGLNGPGLECPPLVGTGVEWPPPGPLGRGSLKIQVWTSRDSLTFPLSKVIISATLAPNRQKDSKIDKIGKITFGPGLGCLAQVGVWLGPGMEWPLPVGTGVD